MKREETIDYNIKASWHAISRMYNQKAIKHGITTSIAYVLLNISSSEGTPATKIAPLIGLEARSLTRMLKNLEEKGLIYREKDPNDGRSVRVFLTEKGYEKKGITIKTVKAFNSYIRQRVEPEKLNAFFEVIGRINEMVEHDDELKELIGKE